MHSDKHHHSSRHHPGARHSEQRADPAPVGDPPTASPAEDDATGSGGGGAGATMGASTVSSPVDPPGELTPVASPEASADELEEQRDKYLRLAAEYDNYRRRTLRERQEVGGRAQADLVKLLVDPLDDLARFAHIDPASTDAGAIVQGVDMVERKIMKALAAAGLQVINPVNQVFDPALHEAVSTERALSPEDDHLVARVYQPGYVFNGQLLRPARVVVNQWNG
jgi:molecular chaperone GrpE